MVRFIDALFVAVGVNASSSLMYGTVSYGNAGPAEPYSTADQAFEAAGHHPNATTAVPFTVQNGASEMWAWRVNASELAVPNSGRYPDIGSTNANYSLNYTVANVQWEFQWPSNGTNQSLQAYLYYNQLTLYYYGVNLPRVTGTNGVNGSCSAVLGSQCIQSIQSSSLKLYDSALSNITGCDDQFIDDEARFQRIDGTLDQNIGTFYPGDTIESWTTPANAMLNQSAWTEVKSSLNMLVLSFQPLNHQYHVGTISPPIVLCQFLENTSGAMGNARPAIGLLAVVLMGSLVFPMLA